MAFNILVIDDMQSISLAVSSILAKQNCIVDHAETGSRGLELAKDNIYDAILLDIHLPDSSGIDICRLLKKWPTYKHRPVLLLTSDSNSLEEGIRAGASDYIVKPFRETEMIARVFAQINLSKAQRTTNQEKKQLKRDLKEEQTKLEDVQNDLQKYFYQTSHRLRAPLNSMQGLLHLLEIDHPHLADNEYVKKIRQSIERLFYINCQISTIGNIKSHRTNNTSFNLLNALDDIFAHTSCDHQNIHIEVDETLMLYTDEVLFKLGIQPVIDNAIKYARQAVCPHNMVEVSTRFERGHHWLTIRDSGPGISANSIHKVFDMFYIGDERSRGNGLGLFISKIALDLLNMNIKIKSAEEHYTQVSINITNALNNNNGNDDFKTTA